MRQHLMLSSGFAVGLAILSLARVPVEGQTSTAAGAASRKPAAAKSSTPLRTVDGQPDLQGMWSNATPTPLERPKNLGTKAFYTDAELAELVGTPDLRNQTHTRADEFTATRRIDPNNTNPFNEAGRPLRQTSLVIDPPDGQLPSLTEEAKRREKELEERTSKRGPADSYEDRNNSERCLSRGAPKLPGIYNANFQIWQNKDYVAILQEMIHEVRIIPLDQRAHFDRHVDFWLGDSVGHWEGDTLVVDTTNYNDKIRFNIYNCCGVARSDLHVVERFKRVDANTIDYQYTVDAPKTYTRPFTVSVPLKRTTLPIYEYACHEGNYSLGNMLTAARAEEKAGRVKRPAGPAPKQPE